jgi:hypothetical protein
MRGGPNSLYSGALTFRTMRARGGPRGSLYLLGSLTALTVAINAAVIMTSGVQHTGNALCLLVAVTLLGLWFCRRTQARIGDRRLSILAPLWVIKICATILLLRFGWMPELEGANPATWGYDPQRYYLYSQQLIEAGWDTSFLNTNFTGIILYYAGLMTIFGVNPFGPTLINCIVTLLGTLVIIRFAYACSPMRSATDHRLGYLLLIPEVLWYDALTARETLMAVLLSVAIITTGRILSGTHRKNVTDLAIVAVACVLAILAVRTTMLLPVVGALGLYLTQIRMRSVLSPFVNAAIIGAAIAAVMLGPILQAQLGGYEITAASLSNRVASPEIDEVIAEGFSQKSIGRALVPSNAFEAVLFAPPRMVLYLIAPFPNFSVQFNGLMAGSWQQWQALATAATSLLMIINFPAVLAATTFAIRSRKTNINLLLLPLAFWVVFFATAAGNFIIHERYRVMFTLLFFAVAWLGNARASPRSVRGWSGVWFAALFAGMLFYVSYKGLV